MSDKTNGFGRRSFLKQGLTGLAAIGAAPGVVKAAALGGEGTAPSAGQAGGRPIVRTLGRTGLKMPIVSMGVMNADNPAVVQAALDTGITLLDTAWGYQRGRNEQMIGEVVKGRPRDSYLVATKIHGPFRDKALVGLKGEAFEKPFLAKLDVCLGRLGLDYVDILYLHNNTEAEHVQDEGVIAAFEKAKKSGKARFVGITTHANEPAVIRYTIAAKAYDVILTGYNFMMDYREDLRRAVAEAAAAGLGVIAMKTQAGVYWDKAKTQKINMRAALKWVLNDPNVTTAVPGFTTFDQLKEDWSVVSDISLSPEEIKDLRLGESVAGLYCQQCGRCVAGCSRALPIPDLMRGYMYAYGYRNLQAAHELVGSLEIDGNPCGDCAGCTAACVKGFDVADRVRDISRLKNIPGDFFA
ncbi:MAG TPA: aldo/keto reductase [Candidatus Aminicenantes bacterium]|nr:aldo/keto reductase [Candidatus Aminicenantes bacterium]HRY64968.1 aldo/keto reductase [Candidatus Aminicenantes bacterium]HRZ71881.1 aldo/keto reductase [Candidatus Aminicenantes bacterium]